MDVTIIGAGNSGLAMAAHLSHKGNNVRLWNRSESTIKKIKKTNTIKCKGALEGEFKINCVTNNIELALDKSELILVTTPANSHEFIAKIIAENLERNIPIILNPGKIFGALKFKEIFDKYNSYINPLIAETQTIIYTCRKLDDDFVEILKFKDDVLISTFDSSFNNKVISKLPDCIQNYFIPSKSMVQTSVGNVGMILHTAPLLLNTGWTESTTNIYKHYYEGITPSIGNFIEKLDDERIEISRLLDCEVESTKSWLQRTYNIKGNNIYECIKNNQYYKTIDAPTSLEHRYIFEEIPFALVPLESIGQKFGFNTKITSLIIDLAINLVDVNFREKGRNLNTLFSKYTIKELKSIIKKSD